LQFKIKLREENTLPRPRQKKKMLGEMLISEGLLTKEQLTQALGEQKRHGGRLGTILRSLGYVTEEDIIKLLGEQMGILHVSLETVIIDPDVICLVSELMARRYQVIPLYKEGTLLSLAMVDPLNVFAIDDIRHATGHEIVPMVGTEQDILKAIDRYYGGTSTMQEAIREADQQRIAAEEEFGAEITGLAEDTPVVKFVNTLIGQAIKEGASDVHIEPEGEIVRIRYRVDGLLRDVMTAPRSLKSGVTSRIKIMANLDIAEKRIPQDGRIQMKVGEKDIDIRLSTLPAIFGEKIVMRLLDKGNILIGLKELGFNKDTLQRFEKFIHRPYGLILVTGATGSGKTTTLYAVLQKINTPEKNIVTIEDPVEYQLRRVTQVQVNAKVGVTFATGLRSILRQDPDVVMVGEIRDRETAMIAIQAALTGHLVMTTLHTNDAPGAIARLVDMGVEPFLIASSIISVVAQKLIRRICEKCRSSYMPPAELLKNLSIMEVSEVKTPSFAKGRGCQECRGTGYAGRVGIFELLPVDDMVRNLIVARASSAEIRKMTLSKYRTLRAEGFTKAAQGITTLEEVVRATQEVE
jgi:type IV pilus assembly protein PilB